MKWTIEGADRRTGKEVVVTIKASSRADAEKLAQDRGILVSGIHQQPSSGDDALNALVAANRERATAPPIAPPVAPVPTAPLSPEPRPQTVDYRPPAADASGAPKYSGLAIGKVLLLVFAIVYYLLAVIFVASAVIVAMGPATTRITTVTGTQLAMALGMAMAGGILHAASSACEALRDIARNSFR